MESWKKVWREGFAPQLSVKALTALRQALATDDKTLIQGATTSPPPLQCCEDWQVDAACPIGFCGWHGDDLETVGQVEEFLARHCKKCDELLGGEPGACRYFLNFWDDSPRSDACRLLLAEVDCLVAAQEEGIRRAS